ncbi:hypothetical protein ACP275_13G196500 [Erythranthe tilingii]
MAYYMHRIIFIALVFAIAVPSSLGDWDYWTKPQLENYLQELCSQTNDTQVCWNFIKDEANRFNETSILRAAIIALDPVEEKADEIHDKLDRLYNRSKDKNLKNKYLSCSKNYNDAISYLKLVRRSFVNYDFDNILGQVDDAVEELNICSLEFTDNSFDPAHIRNRNNEFRICLEFLKAATINWIHVNPTD